MLSGSAWAVPSISEDFRSSQGYLAYGSECGITGSSCEETRTCFGLCLRLAGARGLYFKLLGMGGYARLTSRNDSDSAIIPNWGGSDSVLWSDVSRHASTVGQFDALFFNHAVKSAFPDLPSPSLLPYMINLCSLTVLASFFVPSLPHLMSFAAPSNTRAHTLVYTSLTVLTHTAAIHTGDGSGGILSLLSWYRDAYLLRSLFPLVEYHLSRTSGANALLHQLTKLPSAAVMLLYLYSSLVLALFLLRVVESKDERRRRVFGLSIVLGVIMGFMVTNDIPAPEFPYLNLAISGLTTVTFCLGVVALRVVWGGMRSGVELMCGAAGGGIVSAVLCKVR
jgi:hypothetical protein